MTWATTVGVDGDQQRAKMWVMMWAMTWAMMIARLTMDDGGVDGGQWKGGR